MECGAEDRWVVSNIFLGSCHQLEGCWGCRGCLSSHIDTTWYKRVHLWVQKTCSNGIATKITKVVSQPTSIPPSISWDHMSYVVRIIHIYYLFNVDYTVLYMWGFVSLCLCILIQHLMLYLQSLALRLSRLRFLPRAWPPCELRQEHGRSAQNSAEFRCDFFTFKSFKQCDCTVFTSSLLLIFVISVCSMFMKF